MFLSKNRILKNSVSFSNESYVLSYEEETEQQQEAETAAEIEIFDEAFPNPQAYVQERMRLQQEAQQLQAQAATLAQKEQMLQQQSEQFALIQQQFEAYMKEQHMQLEKDKKAMYYEMTETLWDQSIALAEKVVQQALDTKQLSMTELLKGVIETLPMSFEKLHISVHPKTYEDLQKEQLEEKESWLLQLVEWKFDFSLKYGEFVLEEDKGYFEYRFEPIFAQLKERLQSERDLKGREDE